MIVFDAAALDDLEEIFGFNSETDAAWAERQLEAIQAAVLILEKLPRLGRALPRREIRELVIPVGRAGYVALYQYEELDELVRILAVRHQREAGYRGR